MSGAPLCPNCQAALSPASARPFMGDAARLRLQVTRANELLIRATLAHDWALVGKALAILDPKVGG